MQNLWEKDVVSCLLFYLYYLEYLWLIHFCYSNYIWFNKQMDGMKQSINELMHGILASCSSLANEPNITIYLVNTTFIY